MIWYGVLHTSSEVKSYDLFCSEWMSTILPNEYTETLKFSYRRVTFDNKMEHRLSSGFMGCGHVGDEEFMKCKYF